jgi:hypothetical protein
MISEPNIHYYQLYKPYQSEQGTQSTKAMVSGTMQFSCYTFLEEILSVDPCLQQVQSHTFTQQQAE